MFQPTVEHFVIGELSEQNVKLTFGVAVTWGGETHQGVQKEAWLRASAKWTSGDGVRIPALCSRGSAPHLYPWGWGK